MDIELVDRWDAIMTDGSRYMTLAVKDNELVDVKETETGGIYVMDCPNGYEVYRNENGIETEGFRQLSAQEMKEVVAFALEQFEAEELLDKAK